MEFNFGNLLHINLSEGKITSYREEERIFKQYIGGSGYAAYFLSKGNHHPVEPLDPQSPILFMTGPLTGTPVPTSGRHSIIARSPLTGIWGEASVGGFWGRELRRAGYDGVLIEGKSDIPVYIWISQDGAQIRGANHIWGKGCQEANSILKKETDSKAVIATIGPAGENLVSIAGIFTDDQHARTAARCGLGAVCGAKNLKALVVRGTGKIPVCHKNQLKENIRLIIKNYKELTKSLSLFGTAGLVTPCEQIGTLPIKNWRVGSWTNGAESLSGSTLKSSFNKGQFRCAGCPIGCGRVIELDGEKEAGPEYETLGLFGGSCMIDNLEAICRLNILCNQLGIDTIDAGALVAFTMELYERGLISKADTGGLELTWGNWKAAMALIKQISRKEAFGKLLADGLKEAALKIGGIAQEFAIHVKGMAVPAHDPRAFNSLAVGYATSNRGGCHLQGFSHIFERNIAIKEWGYDKPLDRFGVEKKGELVARSQDLMALFDSLALCKFSLFGGVSPTVLNEWLNAVTGWNLDLEEMSKCGEMIFNLKRIYNVKLGISRKDDKLPDRLLTHRRKEGGTVDNLPAFNIMLSDYYEFRGWDEEGLPRPEKAKELNLEPFWPIPA